MSNSRCVRLKLAYQPVVTVRRMSLSHDPIRPLYEMLRGIVSVLPSLSAPGACPSGSPDAGTRARRGSRERGLSGNAASDGGLPAGSSGGIPGLLRRRRKQGRYESRGRRWSLVASALVAAGEDGSSGAPPDVVPERDDAADAPTGDATGASTGELAMQDPASPESEADGNGNSGRLGPTW